jgi:ubiquinone/menaquinone biosynthesis C-methylase UbiE
MSIGRNILIRMFGRPEGLLGRLGGAIMARMNDECGAWVLGLLAIEPQDRILEVGFGPGVVIQNLVRLMPAGHVAGVDPSREMFAQAQARNAAAIRSGHVDLRLGSVDSLPFKHDSFHKALAVNSMQVWPDPLAGLREVRRLLKPGGRIALGFTPYSGQRKEVLSDLLTRVDFTAVALVENSGNFCALGSKGSRTVRPD